MNPKIAKGKTAKREVPATEEVDEFIASLDHPFKEEIIALREIILAADSSIAEGIKWNAPSFRTSEYFATFHLRAKDGVQIILHFGAKKRDKAIARTAVADPESLLDWLSDDRATVKMRDINAIRDAKTAFTNIIRQWIKFV